MVRSRVHEDFDRGRQVLSRFGRAGLLFAVVGAMVAGPGAVGAQQIHGDVNGDGVVSALDAQAILTAVVGLPLPAGFVVANGDADCNNTSVALDAQIVLSAVIGLNVSQYCVGQPFGSSAVRVTVVPGDTSLLINRGIQLLAQVRDTGGFAIQRPIVWSTSNSDIVVIDSSRADTAWVKARTLAGTVTLSAFSDGAQGSIAIQVVTSYAGVVITPQRSDTLRQLNAPYTFTLRTRDSLGAISGSPTGTWSTSNTSIATVTSGPANTATVTTNTNGTVFLHVTSTTSPTLKDSVRLVVRLPALNSCSGTGGTLHPGTTYTTPQSWLADANPHFVTGNQTFGTGSGLTVGPGALLCFSSGVSMSFNAGTRLVARGKPDSLITFTGTTATTFWSGIQFGSAFSYAGTAPSDTSVITNALFERGGSSLGLSGREQHALVMDSVRLRQFQSFALRLRGPGSRFSRGTIDTMTSPSATVASVGRGVLEFSTIRAAGAAFGVSVNDTGSINNVQIIGAATAISDNGGINGARLNDVTISGTTAFALDLQNMTVNAASANVQISGGTGGAFRGEIGNLGILFPDSVSQSMLKGQGKDTVFITGGSLTNATLVVRPDLPWVVSQVTDIDTLGVLAPRPGARLLFTFGGLRFQAGGRLSAIGEAAKPIRFGPEGSSTFYGLFFQNPGQGPDPQLAPTAVSNISFAQVDSASGGLGTPSGSFCCAAAIIAGNRHRIIADSIIVRKSLQGAVFLATPGSELKRSLIDTTGNVSSSYTSSYPAVALGQKTLAQNVLIRRSGNVGLYASASTTDTIARLVNVRIVASQDVALEVQNGILEGDLGSVRADSANLYPFRGQIHNLATLANDSVTQNNFFGNTNDVIELTGGTLANRTLTLSPRLRWHSTSQVIIDTAATLVPRPGTNLTFSFGYLEFQRGGTLNAVGEPTKFIRFQPGTFNDNTTGYFYGLTFNNPGAGPIPANAPTAVSTMSYVQVDSAGGLGQPSGGICCSGSAISAGDRHKLILDSIIVRRAFQGAVWMNTPGSELKRSLIDTTGAISSNFTSSAAAVALGRKTLAQNVLIRRSGDIGLLVTGGTSDTTARLTNVRVVGSLGVGLQADNGILEGDLGSVRVDSANFYPFRGRINNFATLANDSITQNNFFGNTNDVVELTGGTLANRTLTLSPRLRWHSTTQVIIDTAATLVPRPGTNLTFSFGYFEFQRGGTLNAVGEPSKFIRFQPGTFNNNTTAYFYGLTFNNPGAGPIPANAPTAVSTMSYVQLDSAGGLGQPSGGICCGSSAISSGDRHRLILDSIIVRRAFQGAVWLATPGSELKRSRIDTTGTIGSNFTTSTAAVGLGRKTLLQDVLVRRSGEVGVYTTGSASDTTARLINVRIVGSLGVALQADNGIIEGDLGSVRADSANFYPFRGRINNFAVLANDSITQNNFFGNTNDVVELTGGTLSNRTLTLSPRLRWHSTTQVIIDTLATLVPRPGTNLTFSFGYLEFQRGGTLNAVGEASKFIRFQPGTFNTNTTGYFYGLTFNNPGAAAGPTSPVAVSTMTYVQLDSAGGLGQPSGGLCCGSSAISSGNRHRLLLDSIIVRRSFQGAVWLATPNSQLTRSRIDTTGTIGSGFVTSTPAVALGDTTVIRTTIIRRSGEDGLYLNGAAITLDSVRVLDSRLDGVVLAKSGISGTPVEYTGGIGADVILAEGNGGVGFAIEANYVTLSLCVATGNVSHGVATMNFYQGVTISSCNLLSNGGNGVNNFTTTNATYIIDAPNNWWGNGTDPNGSGGDGVSANVNTVPLCSADCTNPSFMPMPDQPSTPAIPSRRHSSRAILHSRRRKRRSS